MNDLLIGQILAIFILLYAMAYMVGGKTLSAKLSKWTLKQIKRSLRWIWKQVAGKKARSFYWRIIKGAWKKFAAFFRWTYRKVRP